MPESLITLYERLERIAAYDGPWTVLTDQAELLNLRLEELKSRETRLDDLLVVALVGGSGVGKSTLLNALAGDELARTSEFRPCTSVPTVYYPPGTKMPFPSEWNAVSGSALENLILIDTPDSDTIVSAHREQVQTVLAECDLILMCADSEKYLDEATWSLLRPLQGERTMVCVETKASQAESVREHWLSRLRDEGFDAGDYFRVNSLRSFDRKIAGRVAQEDEYDFARLEDFLRTELTKERIARIKRSNTAGLLSKTLTTLEERVCTQEDLLRTLETQLDAAGDRITNESFDIVSRRLFAQSNLWTYALGRETRLRSKGIVGTLYRLLEAARSIPARMAGWSFWSLKTGTGHDAAKLLGNKDLVEEGLDIHSEELRTAYLNLESELAVAIAKAGFRTCEAGASYRVFLDLLNDRVSGVLKGPARDRIVTRAGWLTSWPISLFADLPPAAFFVYSGYNVVTSYFSSILLPSTFFLHAGSVLGILLVSEIFVLSVAARLFAWSARRAAISDLRKSLEGHATAYQQEQCSITEALENIQRIGEVAKIVRQET